MKDTWAMNSILNLPGHHSIAAISANLSKFGGELTISDCSDVISLSLDSYSLDDCVNTLHKIDVLYKVISELKSRYGKIKEIRDEYPDIIKLRCIDDESSEREKEMIDRIEKVLNL